MKRSITIPESLNDITLEQWQKYVSIEDPTDEQCVEILCNITPQEVLELPNEVYDKITDKVTALIPELNGSHKVIKRFYHRGKMYGMIPNFDKISYGANKDILATIGDWDKMHYAMNALYRPVIKTSGDYYEIDKYRGEETINDMRDIPLDVVFSARVFFYNLTNALLKAIPNYLQRVVEEECKGQMPDQITKENGEAMMKHIASLKETLEDSMK